MPALPPLLALGATIGVTPVAEAPEIDLQWVAPGTCPRAEHVRARIEQLLTSTADVLVPVSVIATVRADGGEYELELAMQASGGRDERRMRAASCDDLARATALIVATMVDPVAVAARLDAIEAQAERVVIPEPIPPSASEFETQAPVASPRAAALEPHEPLAVSSPADGPHRVRRPVPVTGAVRLDALAGVAALPRVDAGLSLSIGLLVSRARVELGVAHLFAQSRAHPSRPGVALRIRATTATARACGVPTFGAWELPLCGGAEVGALSAQGHGDAVSNADVVRSPYAALFVEAHAAWRASQRFALWIGVQGLIAVARPAFTVADLEPFVRSPMGGGRAKFGVEVRFP